MTEFSSLALLTTGGVGEPTTVSSVFVVGEVGGLGGGEREFLVLSGSEGRRGTRDRRSRVGVEQRPALRRVLLVYVVAVVLLLQIIDGLLLPGRAGRSRSLFL